MNRPTLPSEIKLLLLSLALGRIGKYALMWNKTRSMYHSRSGPRAGFLLDFFFKNKESFVLLFVFTVNRQFKALGLHVRRWKWKPPFFKYKMLLVQLKRRACQLAFVNVSCYHVTNPLNNFAAAFQLLGTGLSFQIESNSQRLYNFQHSMVIIKDLFPASKLSILNQKVTTEESRREARDSATKAIKHQKVNT